MLPLAESDVGDIFKAAIILIAFVLMLWVAVAVLRKRLKEDDAPLGTGFTLADLRQLHREGKMTTEEFEKAKALLLATLAKPAKPTNEPKPPGDFPRV